MSRIKYNQLPQEAKLALDNWASVNENLGRSGDPEFDEMVREHTYTLEQITVSQAKQWVMENDTDLRKNWNGDFEAYHEWYKDGFDIPNHRDSMWPVIDHQGDYAGAGWADGWHRFHSYIAHGKSHIPVMRMHIKGE